jgi:hypothetical protein
VIDVAEAALFIGWGAPVRGREAKGLEVFGEAAQFFGQLGQDGAIESFDAVILGPHGGDLYGFFLLRATTAQLDQLRARDDFMRLIARAGLLVERLGVVPAAVDEGIQQQIGIFQEAVQELT